MTLTPQKALLAQGESNLLLLTPEPTKRHAVYQVLSPPPPPLTSLYAACPALACSIMAPASATSDSLPSVCLSAHTTSTTTSLLG